MLAENKGGEEGAEQGSLLPLTSTQGQNYTVRETILETYRPVGEPGTQDDLELRQEAEDRAMPHPFIAAAYQLAAQENADRIRREFGALEKAEWERRRELLRNRIINEQGRVNVMMEQYKARQAAQQLRDYVQAVRSAGYYAQSVIAGGRDSDAWCDWAIDEVFNCFTFKAVLGKVFLQLSHLRPSKVQLGIRAIIGIPVTMKTGVSIVLLFFVSISAFVS